MECCFLDEKQVPRTLEKKKKTQRTICGNLVDTIIWQIPLKKLVKPDGTPTQPFYPASICCSPLQMPPSNCSALQEDFNFNIASKTKKNGEGKIEHFTLPVKGS
nr:uncharacterized protein LOC109408157 [Aedes albopictus]